MMTFHPAHPRTEYDSHALDWHPSLQEQAELRRESTSTARVVGALGLVVCLVMGWACVQSFDFAVLPEAAQAPMGAPAQ